MSNKSLPYHTICILSLQPPTPPQLNRYTSHTKHLHLAPPHAPQSQTRTSDAAEPPVPVSSPSATNTQVTLSTTTATPTATALPTQTQHICCSKF